jgi:hypothetical protein
MAHTKAKLRRMSNTQLIALLWFLLNWLKVDNPKLYREAETEFGLAKRGHVSAITRSKSERRAGKRKQSPAQKAALRKAIRANPRMNAESKRKALRKLGEREA